MKLRQQYHFRTSDKGLLAWDVLKLIDMCSGLKPKDVLLSSIQELDEPYWYSGENIPTSKSIAEHARLIMDSDLAFPVILCSKGRLMDGMHRVCKAHIIGAPSVNAVQFPTYIEPHYIGKQPDELPY